MVRVLKTQDTFVDIHFPAGGINVACPFGKQPAVPMPDGSYARTTPVGLNVRGYEPGTNRRRGGQRAGLVRYVGSSPVAGWIIQELNTVTGSGYAPPGGFMQLSQSGRVVTLVAVSQGSVFVTAPGGTSWTPAINSTGETPALNFSGVVYSASLNQKLWFADGINQAYYDPSQNTVFKWAVGVYPPGSPSAGQPMGVLPVDSQNNTPRLIVSWRGRILQSGLLLDPQDIFGSAVSDPTNWDYSPPSTSPTQAFALSASPLGIVGDVVTTLIPYTDDVLVIGGDHTIWMIQGDPMAGGQIDLITNTIGMAWGIPWCMDPYGTIYFISNRSGIYTFTPGNLPQRISQGIEKLLAPIDTGANNFRLLWDDRFQGLHVFISPLAAPAATTHFFYEQRSGAWWTDQFSSPNFDPIACCTLDGNTPGDRVPLIGSWDGFVRTPSTSALTDDGLPINSQVMIGPLTQPNLDDLMYYDVQAVLGVTSGQVTGQVFVGDCAENALNSVPVFTGPWLGGRNLTNFVRRSGHALYTGITATNPWSFESCRVRLAPLGRVRQRGR